MSGCISGIETAIVKAPNGKPSLLFQNLLLLYNKDFDLSYSSYLKSHIPSFDALKVPGNLDNNGELLAQIVFNQVDNAQDYRYSKELQNAEPIEADKEDAKDTEPQSIAAKLLEDAKLIVDPEIDVEGNQSDSYGITSSIGGAATIFLGRVTNFMGNFSLRKGEKTDKDGKVYTDLTDAIVQREADNLFLNKRMVIVDKVEYTKDEFIAFKKAVYQQGKTKGDLIHTLLQDQIAFLNGDSEATNKLQSKIEELEILSSQPKGSYDWVKKAENFSAIMKNAGINIDFKMPKAHRDKVYSEVPIANLDMEVAGKVDTLIERPNGRLKIIDYKTGNRLNNEMGSRIMNYGNQEFSIYDNALGLAKLQVMLYSVIIKANNPTAQFDAPVVMHIPNEEEAKAQRNAHQVEVRDYLRMIEQYYKNEKPEVYKTLIAKSPDTFNPSHYGATRNTSFTQDMIDDKTGRRDDEMLSKYELELEQLVTRNEQKGKNTDDNSDYRSVWSVTDLKRRDILMQKILQARTIIGLPKGSTQNYEVAQFTKWLGTINDTQNPYIQAYSQVVNQARLKARAEYDEVENTFNGLLSKMMEAKIGKRSGVEKAFKGLDTAELFKNLIYETSEIDSTDGQRRVSSGLITEKDSTWNSLLPEEQALANYMRDKMSDIFEQVLVSGSNAVVQTNKNGKTVTKLDIYNKNLGADFKMSPDFLPKVAVTSSEMKFRAMKDGVEGTKNYLRHVWAKKASNFYEKNVEGYNQHQYGIPVKYLGTGSAIYNPDTHTANLELSFKTYMQHMINKKHYDQVYALGDAVKGYLELQSDGKNNKINKNAAEFVGYHMHRNLIGRIEDDSSNYWRKGLTIGTIRGADINFSAMKFMKTMTSGVAAAALWAKIPASAKNAVAAEWVVAKEALVNSLASTEWGGVATDRQDLSAKHWVTSNKLWAKYQITSMKGDGKADPVHVFMKTFRMYPEMTELGGAAKNLLTEGATAFNKNHLYVLYSYPENKTTANLAMTAMMSMKVKGGPYAGQSMWDVYSNNIKVDPITGEGSYELPADFSRGKLRMGNDSLQELKGLNFLEVQKLHRIVQNVKGGYRTEERSMIESTALGEMFMLFRRYLPAAIINGTKSKYYDPSMGTLVKTEQEDVYEWQARLAEGRWRTFGGVIGAVLGMSKKRGYQWEDLSDLQRRNVIDAGVTLATWATTSAIVAVMFGDSDDEDSMKKWSSEMNMRIVDQWNGIDWLNASTSQPAAVKSILEVFKGMWEVSVATSFMAVGGDDEDIYTKRGDLRGSNKILKNIPLSSSYYDAEKFIENSDYWSE